ncbi:MAG TPA: methylated-DNA--[protein]-cysteine S-methyltransferase [Candidatus Eremiobacteraceae bacterium]|nr:methylated-DNA--[protein]-cysteine S-methyltransferase [Candidatus Eremiobacteraceae bacterium]
MREQPSVENGLTGATSTALFDSPVGPLFARTDAGVLIELAFARRARRERLFNGPGADHDPVMNALRTQMAEYFAGKRRVFDIPIRLIGPTFHLRVWNALLDIPYGTTMAYGEIACRIGEPDAARAVGAANGANPIVIIVPCHRVIGANGRLVGFGGGLDRKQFLLDLESGRPTLGLGPPIGDIGMSPSAR